MNKKLRKMNRLDYETGIRYNETKKAITGRPQLQIDHHIFEELCKIGCTKEEICKVFRCSVDGLTYWCKRHYTDLEGNPLLFRDVYDCFKMDMVISLRRAGLYAATVDRNPQMLIWKGKQHLGETDRAKDEVRNYTLTVKTHGQEDEQNSEDFWTDDDEWDDDIDEWSD